MNKRTHSIDLLKFILAILVVFLHTPWVGSNIFTPFTRCAVPCFFMVSGYLLFDGQKIGRERILKNLKHVFHIFLWSSLIYIAWAERCIIQDGTIFIPSARSIINFVLLNEHPFAGHLWYLCAYIYVLLIVMFIDKRNLWRYLYAITPLLLLGDLALGKYSLAIFGRGFPFIWVRNFLFVGLPYFALGTWLKTLNHNTISAHVNTYRGG